MALTTAVEWSVVYLVQRLKMPIDKVPKGKNKTIHALEFINKHLGLRYGALIKDFEALVWLRNCIAHCAGIERDYKYRDNLPKAIKRLKGFSLANWHFLGSHVAIEKNALDKYIEETKHLVVDLHKAAHEQGFLKVNT